MPNLYQPSGPRAVRSLDKIISGAEVEVSGNLQTGVVVQDPVLDGAVVTALHCGAVGAVLQAADGQTWLGNDVEEGVLLWRGRSEEGQMAVKVWDSTLTLVISIGILAIPTIHHTACAGDISTLDNELPKLCLFDCKGCTLTSNFTFLLETMSHYNKNTKPHMGPKVKHTFQLNICSFSHSDWKSVWD